MHVNHTPESEQHDCVPGAGHDWYLINEDLARVWLRVTSDGESAHLEDRIARTKMLYVNWIELLKDSHFQSMLRRVEQEQRAGSPRGVFAARLQAFSGAPTPVNKQVTLAPQAPLTPPARVNTKARFAVAFILGALAGSGLAKATQSTPSHTPAALPNR